MFVSKIKLKDFRNYEGGEVVLSSGVNIFVGQNAQGKTNLLETAVLCSIGKSLRNKDKELIRFGCERGSVEIEVKKTGGLETIQIDLFRVGSKKIFINGMQALRVGELMGVLNTVYFSPDELCLIKDGPSERRRFTDIAISQLSKNYFFTLQKYARILNQRNRLLKWAGRDTAGLDIWDMQLAREGARIVRTRKGFLRRLAKKAEAIHAGLTEGKERLVIEYEGLGGETVEEIEAEFLSALKTSRERDLRLGYGTVGAHKDDFSVLANNIDIRGFGSQGQQRTSALSIKLAELEIFFEETGEMPVLLLDDVFSELDSARRLQLLSRLKNFQTIITCTDLDPDLLQLDKNVHVIKIQNGKLE